MADDPDAYKYLAYTDTVEGFHRKDAMRLWPLIAQPVALVVVIFTFCYDAIYNPAVWSNRGQPLNPTPSYGLIWLWITGLPLAAAVLWNLYSYVEHQRDEARRAAAWPAELAARRVAEANKLRLQQEAERARVAELEAARRQALTAEAERQRQVRLHELETIVLTINANLAAKADFFGDADPAAIRRQVCQGLLALGITDLGLLRDTQNPAVRLIIGEGAFLPKAPLRLSPL